MSTLNDLAARIHALAKAKGWHDPPPAFASFCANLHGEVSEAWEAYRAGKLNAPCDKAERMAEPLTCLEEELADVIIRALDTAAALGVDIDRAVRVKLAYNETRPHRHGGKLA